MLVPIYQNIIFTGTRIYSSEIELNFNSIIGKVAHRYIQKNICRYLRKFRARVKYRLKSIKNRTMLS